MEYAMKHCIILFLLIISIQNFLYASQNEDSSPLINEKTDHDIYVGLHSQLSPITNHWGLFAAPRIMYVANKQLGVGASLKWQLNNSVHPDDPVLGGFAFGYGGLILEYIFSLNRLFHISLSCFGGIGSYFVEINTPENNLLEDKVAVLEPELDFLLNITDFIQLNIGASYRLTMLSDYYASLERKQIDGISLVIGLRFGTYSNSKK